MERRPLTRNKGIERYAEKVPNGSAPLDNDADILHELMLPTEDEDEEDYILEGLCTVTNDSKYRRAYDKVVRNMRMLGYTKGEICKVLGIAPPTIQLWRKTHPKFNDAWWAGGSIADGRVARAVFKRAVGFKATITRTSYSPKTGLVRYEAEEYYPPDTGAGMYWLNNRQPNHWKNANHTALTGANGKDLQLAAPSINVMVVDTPPRQQMISVQAEPESTGV